MNAPRILIAGIGNIFLGDDVFGVEVARRLSGRALPEGVRVVDFGIRGLDLTYALLESYDAVILVDAAPRGGRPGTLYVLEIASGESSGSGEGAPMIEAHGMDPVKVLRLAAAMGGQAGRVFLVGCEPETPADVDEMSMEMSESVRAAVDEAIPLIESLVGRLVRGEPVEASGVDTTLGKEVGT
jgi:hydrogenase maturation protease